MKSPNWHPFPPVTSTRPARATALFERRELTCAPGGGDDSSVEFRRRRGGFTMVELLVVMVLISMLSTLTMVSINGIGKSSALSAGGNRLASLVNQARQNSMSRNVMTALVLVTGQASPSLGDYRVAALLEYNAADVTPCWKQVSRWENLPTGVVLDRNPSDSTFLANNSNVSPASAPLPVPLPVKYQGAAISSYAARVFLPNGGLYNPSTSSKIQLVEGLIDKGNVIYTHTTAGGIAANYYCIAIIGITGRTKIERP